MPWSTAAISSGSAADHGDHAVEGGDGGPRQPTRQRRHQADHRGGVVDAEQHGQEHHRGPGHGPLEHGHLDQQSPHPLGGLDRHLEAHVGPERHPAHDGLVDAELVEQRHHVPGVGVHAVGRGVPGLVRPSVAGQVEQDDLETPIGEIRGQAPAELVVEQEAVEEHEDARPLAVALVLQPQPLDLEGALLEGPPLEQPGHEADGRQPHEAPGLAPRFRVVFGFCALPVSALPLVLRARPGLGARHDARRIRSAEPGPHGRHPHDDTRVPSRCAPLCLVCTCLSLRFVR